MNEEKFLIQFIPAKHCFLQFSNKWFQKLNIPKCACVKLTHPVTKEELRFSCTPQPSFGLNNCSVGINATFAQSLNLHENDLVVMSSEESLPPLRQVFLTPLSSDDYDILEMSRETVELSLLNQIRAVYIKQILVVWVSKTMHLKLSVDNLVPPLTYGCLEQMTELVIENVTQASTNKAYTNNSSISNTNISKHSSYQQPHKNKSEQSIWHIVSDYLPEKILDLFTPVVQTNEETMLEIDNASLVCRVHPFPLEQESTQCCNNIHDEKVHPFNVFIFEKVLKSFKFWSVNTFIQTLVESDSQAVVCRLDLVPKNSSKQNNVKSVGFLNESSRSVIVRLYKIAETCSVFTHQTNVCCVFLSKHLRHFLNLETGAKVSFSAYTPPPDQLLIEVKLLLTDKLDESEESQLIEKFSDRLTTRNGVLVNNHCPLVVPMSESTDRTVLIELLPSELECWPLTHPELQVCSLVVASEQSQHKQLSTKYVEEPQLSTPQAQSVFEDHVNEGVTALECGLGLREDKNKDIFLDNILITGKKGSGKSTLAEAIYSSVSGPPHFVHVCVLQCEPLKGKKPESIGKILAERLEECMYFQPSVLVLEDLPSVAGAATNDLQPSQDAQYWLRLAVVLKELLYLVPTSQYVSLIATAESRSHVHPQLCATRGRHTFTTFLNIPPLNIDFRQRILDSLFQKRLINISHLNINDLAKNTEGSVAQDLSKLVDRVVFKSCQRNLQEQSSVLDVRESDVEAALSGFVPSQLANVSLKQNNNLTFDCVGGLDQAKQLLTEVLIWPTKYPEIFSQCPLKLEKGVLLYGTPGTGKTLLANAVVGESGLNLITVKGPELLSKYIGASEEAVRNVFQKAQSAAPCILFFDEFDSLAPRRGHDSTGVTDRVVNQLLTQMDGVEALEGVWVLAAASRPDLLDPALLRPGRIGTLVHCTLPHQTERLSILQKLSGRLQLTDGAKLDVIAAKTEGFTGADLQAVLFTAQMNAFEALHQDFDNTEVSNLNIQNVLVSQEDLLLALQNTSPSLKPEDSARFQSIYDNFQKSRSSTQNSETSLKVTLA